MKPPGEARALEREDNEDQDHQGNRYQREAKIAGPQFAHPHVKNSAATLVPAITHSVGPPENLGRVANPHCFQSFSQRQIP
jgi:hypothetical protein